MRLQTGTLNPLWFMGNVHRGWPRWTFLFAHIDLRWYSPRTMNVSIFTVCCKRHIALCEYNLRSAAKFATGFSEHVMVVPNEDIHLFQELQKRHRFRLVTMDEPRGKGMLNQQWAKCMSDQFCPDADVVFHLDSDYIFTQPTQPQDYLIEGKPILVVQPYASVQDVGHRGWKLVAETALGFTVEFDGMVRQPILHVREVYPLTRKLVEAHTGQEFRHWILSGRNEHPQTFAEFPTLGGVVMRHLSDRYHIIDATKEPVPADRVMRGWSHGGPDFEMEFQDGDRTTARKKFAQFLD